FPKYAPSASKTAQAVWYTPAALRSNNETTSSTFFSLANRPNLSVVGPGTASAKLKSSASSVRQKYSPANNSCRQTICAPRAAASRIFPSARSKFSSLSLVHRICTSPTTNLSAICNVPRPPLLHFFSHSAGCPRHGVCAWVLGSSSLCESPQSPFPLRPLCYLCGRAFASFFSVLISTIP